MSISPEIKVIVKTPTQKTEDHIIKCHLDWTVSKLKKYISENFPSKPNVNDQRLIYSGHLLKDEKNLKEVFQPEQDDTTFIVHLVLSPKDNPNETVKNDKERNVSNSVNEAASSSNSSNQQNSNFSNVDISQFSFNLNDPSIDYTSLYAQQMQYYQQMYVNYMAQFLVNNNLDQTPQLNNTSSTTNSPIILNPFFFNPLFTVPTLTPLIQSTLNNANNTDGVNSRGQQATNATANERLNDNQAQLNNENDIDNQNNGILDRMNIFCNILILISLLSASLSRTLFVMGVCLFYYLIQTGFFSSIYVRFFGDQNLNNRNQPINEEQIQQMMDDPDGLRRRNTDNQDTDINNNQPQPHFMDKFRFLFMIISSLFQSLLPNNGPIVPAN